MPFTVLRMKSLLRHSKLVVGLAVTIGAAAVSVGCPNDPVANEVTVINSISPSITYDSTYAGDTLQAPQLSVSNGSDKSITVELTWTSSNPAVVKIVGSAVTSSDATGPKLAALSEGDATITATITGGNYGTSSGPVPSYHGSVSVAGAPASIKILPSPIILQVYQPGIANDAAFTVPKAIVKSASGREIKQVSIDWSEVLGNGVAEFCNPFAGSQCSRTATTSQGLGSGYYGIKSGTTRLRAALKPVAGRTLPALVDTANVIVGGGTVVVASSPVGVFSAFVGDSKQYVATVKDAAGTTITNPGLQWSSSRPTLASVDQAGKLTVLAAGADGDTLTVLALSPTLGITGKLTLNVYRKAAFVALTPAAVSIPIGGTARVFAHFTDASGGAVRNLQSGRPEWTSGDDATADVRRVPDDTTGTIVGIKAGSTTATVTYGAITATLPVTVVPIVKTITLQYTSGTTTRAFNVTDGESIVQNATAKIVATALDANGTSFNDQFTFATTATGITLAPTGLNTVTVTGVTPGTAYPITISSASDPTVKVIAKISVTAPQPTGGAATTFTITSTPANATTGVGGTVQFTANPRDAAGLPASGCTVGWNTDASSVASINNTTGLATGVGAGATTVRASCNGTNVGSAAKLTVTDGTFGVTKVAISPKKYDYVSQGGTSTFAAVVTQTSTGATAPVVWSIDAAATAAGVTIDQTGTVRVPTSTSTTFGGGVKITATAGGQSDIAWLTYGFAGSARGTITSTSGRFVGGSTATATPTTGGAQVSAAVDDNGQFYLVGLVPGSYTVSVSLQGVPGGQVFTNVIVTAGAITPITLTAFASRAQN